MGARAEDQLDAYLDNVVNRVQQLRQLNLFTEAERQRALEEIRDVQGALAMCRGLLRSAETCRASRQRRAA